MACNGASCQSGCYNEEEHGCSSAEKFTVEKSKSNIDGSKINTPSICLKCKSNEATISIASGEFCVDCFRINMYTKFKFAVTSNGMISPSDNLLLAFSGGPSSRVALQFVHEMQLKAQRNFDASRDRSLPVFGVGVAFIDESDIHSVPSHDLEKAIEEMRAIVLTLSPPIKQFHVTPIRSIYSSETSDGRERLKELVNAVTDATGKEDLLEYLRMLSLQKVALENGYTKLVLGSCTSRIACHVLAATIKGQGYSLAADIQYVDARWEVPVMLPLHDCLMQELNMLCTVDSLKVVEVFKDPHAGINGLISSFVKLLQEENPSRECTIVRTAGKLTPFHFNVIPEADDSSVHLVSRRRQKKYNLKPTESLPPESFCSICSSPLVNFNQHNSNGFANGQTDAEVFRNTCCASCQFQILPKDPSSMKQFYSHLPQPIISRAKNGSCGNQQWLRDQIQDCLLSDTEDGI